MTKVTLADLANLQNENTAVSVINANSATIETAFDNTLSLDGSSPNQMGSNLDMNNNAIVNLPAPVSTSSPARLIDVTSNPLITVPPVGTSGATVPLLNGINTWSAAQTHTAPISGTNLSLSGTLGVTGNTALGGTLGITGVTTFSATPVFPANSIANASLGTMAANTVKGSIAGGTPADLTATQLTTLVNAPTTSLKGAFPAFGSTGYSVPATNAAGNALAMSPITHQLLATLTASTSATLSDIVSFTSAFSSYELVFNNILPTTTSSILQLQVRSGGSFQATTYLTSAFSSIAGAALVGVTPTTYIPLGIATQANTGAGISGVLRISNPSATALSQIYGTMCGNTITPAAVTMTTSGYWNSSAVITGFQILFSAGNISSGTVKIYGIL